jgi:hypothetical protein
MGRNFEEFQKSTEGGPSFGQVVEKMLMICEGEEMGLFAGIARQV